MDNNKVLSRSSFAFLLLQNLVQKYFSHSKGFIGKMVTGIKIKLERRLIIHKHRYKSSKQQVCRKSSKLTNGRNQRHRMTRLEGKSSIK